MDRDLESRLAQAEIQRAKLHCSRFFKGQRTLVEELYQRIQDGEQRLPHDAHTQALLARESQVLWSSSIKSPHRDSKGTTTSSRMSVRDLERCGKTHAHWNACMHELKGRQHRTAAAGDAGLVADFGGARPLLGRDGDLSRLVRRHREDVRSFYHGEPTAGRRPKEQEVEQQQQEEEEEEDEEESRACRHSQRQREEMLRSGVVRVDLDTGRIVGAAQTSRGRVNAFASPGKQREFLAWSRMSSSQEGGGEAEDPPVKPPLPPDRPTALSMQRREMVLREKRDRRRRQRQEEARKERLAGGVPVRSGLRGRTTIGKGVPAQFGTNSPPVARRQVKVVAPRRLQAKGRRLGWEEEEEEREWRERAEEEARRKESVWGKQSAVLSLMESAMRRRDESWVKGSAKKSRRVGRRAKELLLSRCLGRRGEAADWDSSSESEEDGC